ncbi:hypothetical protein [Priestia flexa]|uniref:hypothetical protein n=1 Tax=Priestia flexa TaxID=86664 RepID=UPI000473F1D7|nr:hypothetical protein [Priestia flexa]
MNINDICVIGLGQCGGNIANLMGGMGILSGAINFSSQDLNSINDVHYKLKLLGSEGLGHDRKAAIGLLSNYPEILISFIKSHFESSKVIFVPFGSAGGSGSGLSVVTIDILMNLYPNKAIVAVPVIPHNNESITALANNQQVFEELSELECCILPIDNEQIRKNHSNAGKSKIYKHTNESFVEDIIDLYNFTECISVNGSFDRRDFINLFKQSGFATILSIDDVHKELKNEGKNLTVEGINQLTGECLSRAIYAPIEHKSIGKAAIIIDSNDENVLDNVSYSVFKRFENQPLDIFEGIYNSNEKSKLMIVYTGLSVSEKRLDKIDEILENRQIQLKNNTSGNNAYKSRFTSLSNQQNKHEDESGKKSTSDILSKYLK